MKSKDKDRETALALRKLGYSYGQIKREINVSKSSLSKWLVDQPLSTFQIKNLESNAQRVEKSRETKKSKREDQEFLFLNGVEKEIGTLSDREIILAGLYLYWGEGTKAADYTVALTNTDPAALKFFVRWLNILGVKNEQMKVVLHLYSDMNIVNELEFWSGYLNIPKSCFRKPHIKKTQLCDITYRGGFKHGTCTVLYLNKDLYLYVKAGLQFIRS